MQTLHQTHYQVLHCLHCKCCRQATFASRQSHWLQQSGIAWTLAKLGSAPSPCRDPPTSNCKLHKDTLCTCDAGHYRCTVRTQHLTAKHPFSACVGRPHCHALQCLHCCCFFAHAWADPPNTHHLQGCWRICSPSALNSETPPPAFLPFRALRTPGRTTCCLGAAG